MVNRTDKDRKAIADYVQASARAFRAAGAKRLPHIADTMANFRCGVTPSEAVVNARADHWRWISLTA